MSKKTKNFLIKTAVFFFWFVVPFIPALISYISTHNNNNNSNVTSNDFTISSYNVILDVNENNKVNVTEQITVDWKSTNNHGIIKFIPEWLQYTGKDKKIIKRKSIVSNLKSEGDPYIVDHAKKKVWIQIGSKDKFVNYGEKTYNIKYTYDMGKDPYKGFDEFIFHAFGDYWNTEINNASIQVNMPKSIDDYNINFFSDKNRKENVTNYVDYRIDGNTLYAKFNQDKYTEAQRKEYCSNRYNVERGVCYFSENSYYNKKLEKSLTVDIELPEGYFVGGSWNYGLVSFILILIIFGITIYIIYLWFKYGKNYSKPIKTIEFYPPKNMDAAEIGYIYGNHSGKKLTISLVVQLASKGYIKIDETKNNKIIITNLVPALPKPLEPFDYKSDNKNINIEERKKEYNIKLKQYETDVLYYNNEMKKFPKLTHLEALVYDYLIGNKRTVRLNKNFYNVFDLVESNLSDSYINIIQDKNSSKKLKISILCTILVIFLYIMSYLVFEDLDPKVMIMYKLSRICIFINIFFTIFMKRKTKYGEKIATQIRCFRQFLISVEKPRLEALVNENPYYFYDILPYTYVLNVSKKWIKKFEDISKPKLDMGTFNYNSDSSYYNFYKNVRYPYSGSSNSSGSSSRSSYSSNSSSFSSHSSRGGGCSSCGGGGSW